MSGDEQQMLTVARAHACQPLLVLSVNRRGVAPLIVTANGLQLSAPLRRRA